MRRLACALIPILVLITAGAAPAADGLEAPHPVHPPECLQSSVWFLDHGPSFTSPPLIEPAVDGPLLAIVDTAFDLRNPTLQQRFAAGYDFVDRDPDPGLPVMLWAPMDQATQSGRVHGTAVASVVATLAPRLRLGLYRAMGDDCQGYPDVISQAIVRAVHDGARVLLLPLGTQVSLGELRTALDYAVEHDVLVVAAAGNQGKKVTTSVTRQREVVGVAAVDDRGVRADFSSYGSHVTLADWGVSVPVMLPDVREGWASGTSMAAARTAAAAGLLRLYAPELSAEQIVQILEATAAQPRPASDDLGAGITDLDAALMVVELLIRR
jgi:subtilisin family serine protease